MNVPKKMNLPRKLFYSFGVVCAFLGALICLGMILAMLSSKSGGAAQFLQDYLAYVLGFAAIMYGNAAGGIIAHHFSNK